MEKEMDIFYSAFVATNKIYHPDAPEKEEGKTDQAELKRIALAMLGMSPVKIHRTLTNSSTEN